MNELDEMTGPVNSSGRDINVIEKQIPVKTGFGSTIFEIVIWVIGFIPAGIVTFIPAEILTVIKVDADEARIFSWVLWALGILPGVIYFFMKISAENFFRKLQQKIQADASQIDNFLEQRVQILQNVVPLVTKAIDLDKDVIKSVAELRSGTIADENRNVVSGQIDQAYSRLFPQVEAYPDLKAHATISDAMRQNNYLQKEITAARALYNDTVNIWNADIFVWPVKMIVAARAGYTTRIPYTAPAETKDKAGSKFF